MDPAVAVMSILPGAMIARANAEQHWSEFIRLTVLPAVSLTPPLVTAVKVMPLIRMSRPDVILIAGEVIASPLLVAWINPANPPARVMSLLAPVLVSVISPLPAVPDAMVLVVMPVTALIPTL